MIKTSQVIDLNRIDWTDDLFRMSFFPDLTLLEQSILREDIINPPWVQLTRSKKYRIVCGYRRLSALLKIDRNRATVFVVSKDIPDRCLFEAALNENASIRQFNPVEKAHILNLLFKRFKIPETEIRNSFLPLLFSGDKKGLGKSFEAILDFPSFVQKGFAAELLSADIIPLLTKLDHEEQEFITELIAGLRLGKNRQKMLATLLDDWIEIQKKPLKVLWNQDEFKAIQEIEQLTPSQKTERLLGWLHSQRYPEYSRIQEKFDRWLRSLKLPGSMKIEHSPWFESERYACRFEFSNSKEFEKALRKLEQMRDQKKIDSLEKLIESE